MASWAQTDFGFLQYDIPVRPWIYLDDVIHDIWKQHLPIGSLMGSTALQRCKSYLTRGDSKKEVQNPIEGDEQRRIMQERHQTFMMSNVMCSERTRAVRTWTWYSIQKNQCSLLMTQLEPSIIHQRLFCPPARINITYKSCFHSQFGKAIQQVDAKRSQR